MPAPSIFTDKEIRFLGALIRENVDFMIVGLSAAALQGAPVVTVDVDLWFRDLADPGIRTALREVGGTYIPPTGQNPPIFAGDAVNLFDIVVHMHGLEAFERERENALKIQIGRIKVPVLPLDQVLHSKEATGREKDRLAIPVLRDALIAAGESAKSQGDA